MYLFYALILLLPMLALKPRKDTDASILDARSTTCIKGILCIYVMLHNLGLDLENGEFKELVCEHTGGVGVGLFFFLSAFGIIRSYQSRGNKYLGKLLLVHIPKLWAVAVFINAITYLSFQRGSYEPLDMWLRILNLDLFNDFNRINRHGWYIASVIALYIIFALVYFVCSRLKNEKRFVIAGIVMAVVPVAARIAAHIADEGGMYTREMPAFAIGCIYATFYDKINEIAGKYFKLGMLVSVVAFILGFLFWEPVATYASAVIIILVSQKYTYYSSVTFFLGRICIGVYLFLHYSSIVMQGFIHNEYLWVLTNAGFIIEVAIMIYAVQYAIEYAVRYITKCIHLASVRD
ncbi:MAG: acyltransferase family protein [Clostridia bacterium]|nr:acyltransferase family protein [Clostridia bacterium]